MTRNFMFAALALTACATEEPSSGLVLDISEADHVGGTFERDGVAIAFDFARAGTRHTMTFHSAAGEPLVSTTLDGAHQTTSVLGGRLVASGVPNAPDPTVVGDRAAQDELDARPEAQLLEGLHDALVDADIDPFLFQPEPPEVASVSDAGYGYFYFAPGEQRDWLSAAGASPTYIYVRTNHMEYDYYNCVAVVADPWSGASDEEIIVPAYSFAYRTKYWWGAIFRVFNAPWYAYWSDGSVCGPATVRIKVSPYRWAP